MLPQGPGPDRHPVPADGSQSASPAEIRQAVRRAAVSPSAIALAAVGVGIGLLAQSVVVAVVLGVGFWFVRLVIAALRARHRGRRLPLVTVDPYAVPEPWRQYVRQAQSAQQRFDSSLSTWPAGPLRDRLLTLQPRLREGVNEVWVVAQRGAALGGSSGGQSQPSVVQLSAELRQVQAEQQRTSASDRQQALARTEEAIAAQLRAAHRTEEAKGEVLDRLRLLTARLDEAVTELLELGLERAGGATEVSAAAATGSLDALLDDIGALHEGLREAGAAAAAPGLEPGAGAGAASLAPGPAGIGPVAEASGTPGSAGPSPGDVEAATPSSPADVLPPEIVRPGAPPSPPTAP
jgi:hypothetical protein